MNSLKFTLHDLKCGNIVNYITAEGDILPHIIDWQDLKWLTEDPKGFNEVHFPMELTEEILIKCGLEVSPDRCYFSKVVESDFFYAFSDKQKNKLELVIDYDVQSCFTDLEIIYFHELQNLHLALTGEHLTFKIK